MRGSTFLLSLTKTDNSISIDLRDKRNPLFVFFSLFYSISSSLFPFCFFFLPFSLLFLFSYPTELSWFAPTLIFSLFPFFALFFHFLFAFFFFSFFNFSHSFILIFWFSFLFLVLSTGFSPLSHFFVWSNPKLFLQYLLIFLIFLFHYFLHLTLGSM